MSLLPFVISKNQAPLARLASGAWALVGFSNLNDGHAGLFDFLEAVRVAIGVGDEDVDFLNAGYLEVGGDTNLAVIGHHDDQAVGVLDHELVDLGLSEVAGGNADLGVNAGAAHNAENESRPLTG